MFQKQQDKGGTRLPALGSRLIKKQPTVTARKKPAGGLLNHATQDDESSGDDDTEPTSFLPSIVTSKSSAALGATSGSGSAAAAAQSAKSRTGSPAHARSGSSGSPSASNTAAAAAADDALATTRLGITLRGLRKVATLLRAKFGDAFEDMSTADVNTQFVELVTERRRCRLVELPEVVAQADVCAPLYFISHCWKNRAARLFGYILDYLQSASEEVAVWLDIFSVNQHEDTVAHQHDISAFGSVCQACSGGTIVVLDREQCSPASRAWCIFEWAHTLAAHGPDGLHMQLNPADRAEVFRTIDVERAECFKPGDKAMILGEVVKFHSSAQRFNAKLKLQLLLEPLSYEGDIRRLAAQAAATGTQWRFEPLLTDWLASSSRALVVKAGAGTGKSTISAVLCATYGHSGLQQQGAGGGGGGGFGVARAKSRGPAGRSNLGRSFTSSGALLGGASSGALTDFAAGPASSYQDIGEASGTERQQQQQWLRLEVAAHHFLKYNDQRRLDPVRIIKSLAFQLAERYPSMSDALLRLDVARVAQLTDAGEAFELLLGRPLKALSAADMEQPVVLLIDALDEADPLAEQVAASANKASSCPPVCGNRTLQLVSEHLARLPPFLRFLFTTRPEAAAGQVLPGLRRLFPDMAIARPEDLRSASASSTNTTAAGTTTGSGGYGSSYRAAAAATVTVSTSGGGGSAVVLGGVMVYYTVSSACEDLLRNAASAVPRTVNRNAPDLDDVYDLYYRIFIASFEKLFLTQEREVADLVAVLVAAQEPLPQSFLQQLGLAKAIPLLPGYPTLFFESQHHLFTLHKSLGDWLMNPVLSREFAANVRRGHGLIGLHLAQYWKPAAAAGAVAVLGGGAGGSGGETAGAGSSVGGGGGAGAGSSVPGGSAGGGNRYKSPYALKYTVAHLAAAADGTLPGPAAAAVAATRGGAGAGVELTAEAAAMLDELLSNFGFLLDVVASGNAPAAIEALGALQRHTRYSYDVLRWLRAELYSLVGIVEKARQRQRKQQQQQEQQGPQQQKQVRQPQGQALTQNSKQAQGKVLHGGARESSNGEAGSSTLELMGAGSGAAAAAAELVEAFTAHALFAPISSRVYAAAVAALGLGWRTRLVLPAAEAGWSACLAVFQGLQGFTVTCVAFSPDGRQLAAGYGDCTVRTYDTATGHNTATLRGPKMGITGLAFRPDGRQLAASSRDKTCRVWDVATGQVILTIAASAEAVTGLAFCPRLRTVRLEPAAAAAAGAAIEGNGAATEGGAITNGGAALYNDDGDDEDGEEDVFGGRGFNANASGYRSAASSAKHDRPVYLLASAGADKLGRLWAWDAKSAASAAAGGAKCYRILRGHTEPLTAVAFTPDGDFVVTAAADKTIRAFELGGQGACTAVVTSHTNCWFTCLAFRGARGLVTGASDGTVWLWDFDPRSSNNKRGVILKGHAGPVLAIAAAGGEAGRMVASGGADKTVRLWEVSLSDGQQVAALRGAHTDAVAAVAFSPTAPNVIASGSHDCTCRLWDVAVAAGGTAAGGAGTGATGNGTTGAGGGAGAGSGGGGGGGGEGALLTEPLACVAYSPDGGKLVSCAGTAVQLWAVPRRGQQPAGSASFSSPAAAAGPTADAAGGPIGTNDTVFTGELLNSGKLFTDKVNAVAFNPGEDGRQVAACGGAEVKLLEQAPSTAAAGGAAATTTLAAVRPGVAATALATSTDAALIAVGCADGGVGVWAAVSMRRVAALTTRDRVNDLSFNRANLLAVASSGTTVQVFDALSGYVHASLPHPDAATACAWARETAYGNQLASGCKDGAVRVWLPSSKQCVFTLRSHTGPVHCVAWSPAGFTACEDGPPQLLLASGGADKVVRLYDAVKGRTERELKGHSGAVLGLAFSQVLAPFASSSASSTGSTSSAAATTVLLVSGSADKTARVHDPRTGACLSVLKGHTDAVSSVAFSVADGGQVFVTGGLDGAIRVYSTKTRACIAALDCSGGGAGGSSNRAAGGAAGGGGGGGGGGPVAAVAFTADGKALVAAFKDGAARLFSNSLKATATFKGHTNTVLCSAYEARGGLLATGGTENELRVFEVATGACIAAGEGHTYWIQGVAFAPPAPASGSGGGADIAAVGTGSGSGNGTGEGGSKSRAVSRGRRDRHHQDQDQQQQQAPKELVTLASASADKSVRVWQLALPAATATAGAATAGGAGGAGGGGQASSAAALAAAACSLQCKAFLKAHTECVTCLQFAPRSFHDENDGDGDGDRDDEVEHGDGIGCSTAGGGSGGGSWLLATGSRDTTVRLWLIQKGSFTSRCIATLPHSNWVTCLAFASSGITSGGRSSGSAGGDGDGLGGSGSLAVTFGGVGKGTALGAALQSILGPAGAGATGATAAALQPRHGSSQPGAMDPEGPGGRGDGSSSIGRAYRRLLLASGTRDGCVYVWDVGRQQQLAVMRGHSGPVSGVAFNPRDDREVASCSEDKTNRVWYLQKLYGE